MRRNKRFFLKPNNAPLESRLQGKVILVESVETLCFLMDLVSNSLKDRVPAISVLRTFLGVCPYSFYSERAIRIIKKYLYCRKWNILPYDKYENIPKWWHEAEGIIEDELNILAKLPKGGQSGSSKKA